MRVLVSTTGTGVGRTEEERRETLELMVDGFINEIVKTIKPDKIVLFYTKETKEMVDLIKSKTDIDTKLVEISNPDDFNLCFRTMLEVLKNYSERDLFINYTYGTKTMSSAMASAAIFVNTRLICIAGERKGGIVRRGLERISIFEPYQFKDMVTIEKIAKLFNVYNFDAAILEAQNLRALDYKDELIKFLKAYELWDRFNHFKAFEMLKESWKSVDLVDKNHVKSNIEFLGRLKSKEKATVEYYKMKLLDLMENAKRRIETGLYDDAVARLYRATEVIAQIMLKERGYDDPIVLSEDDSKRREILRKFEKFAEFKDGKIVLRLGVMSKLELLSELGIDLAIEMKNDEKLRDLLTKRNKSILAHGFVAMAKGDNAEKFYRYLLGYVEKIYGKFFEKDLRACRFPKLEVLK